MAYASAEEIPALRIICAQGGEKRVFYVSEYVR